MAGELNVTGLVNGFDMNSILQQIQAIKSQQILMLKQQQQQISDKKTVISNIQNILKNLQSSISNISDPATVNAKSVNVSNPNILTASITDPTQVSEGAYNINVSQLATNQVYASNKSFSDKNASLGLNSGTLTISMNGNDYNIVYDSTYSLQNLADEINRTASVYNGNFRASVINVGTSSNPQYKLVISGTKTGADNSFTISDTGNAVSTLDLTNIQDAQNAVATANGLQVQSDTNTFANIPGLSFTAFQTGSTVLQIQKDNKPITDALQAIVNYYNQLVDTAAKETGKGGKLSGEYGLNQIVNGIFNQLQPLFTADIINFDRTTGHISLNTSKLNDALTNNSLDLQNTLNNVKNNLTTYLNPYTQFNGILDQYNKSYDSQIQNIQNLIDLQKERVQMEIETLKNQFIKMQMLQAQMNDISARIQATFGFQISK
ncbi:flagellar filament capping protein FliD [Sulfurihydrogenibium sp.]|jgi:flagellar hook-associated protein 2|uniref:flagellar filament capping protein FliD n=1 Tax=Sulfurihydrogenibium sp. TaxID=2053621 RepID=UPI00261D8219|nr:flagellar filament capping protein FliD [Sulfurihydrogenibium sp.]